MKGAIGIRRKIFNILTSICCIVYNKKIVKKLLTPKNYTASHGQNVAIFDSDRKKNQFDFFKIIQILQPIIIEFYSTDSYIVDIS